MVGEKRLPISWRKLTSPGEFVIEDFVYGSNPALIGAIDGHGELRERGFVKRLVCLGDLIGNLERLLGFGGF